MAPPTAPLSLPLNARREGPRWQRIPVGQGGSPFPAVPSGVVRMVPRHHHVGLALRCPRFEQAASAGPASRKNGQPPPTAPTGVLHAPVGSGQPAPPAVDRLHPPDQPPRQPAASNGRGPPGSPPQAADHPPSDPAGGFLLRPAPPEAIDVAALPECRQGHSRRQAMAALDTTEIVKGPSRPEGHALADPRRQGPEPSLLAFPVEPKPASRRVLRPGRMLNAPPEAIGHPEPAPNGRPPGQRILLRFGWPTIEPQHQRRRPLDGSVQKADVVLPRGEEKEAPHSLFSSEWAQRPDDGLGPHRFPHLKDQRDLISVEAAGIQGRRHPWGQESILWLPAKGIPGHHHEQDGPPPHDPSVQRGEAGNPAGGRASHPSVRAPAQGMPARIHPTCHQMGSRWPLMQRETCTPPDPTVTAHPSRLAESQTRGGRPGVQLPNAAPVAPRPKSRAWAARQTGRSGMAGCWRMGHCTSRAVPSSKARPKRTPSASPTVPDRPRASVRSASNGRAMAPWTSPVPPEIHLPSSLPSDCPETNTTPDRRNTALGGAIRTSAHPEDSLRHGGSGGTDSARGNITRAWRITARNVPLGNRR